MKDCRDQIEEFWGMINGYDAYSPPIQTQLKQVSMGRLRSIEKRVNALPDKNKNFVGMARWMIKSWLRELREAKTQFKEKIGT